MSDFAMPRNPDGQADIWQPWPRWRVSRDEPYWFAWEPNATIEDRHSGNRYFATFAEAIAYADQKARGQ